MTDNQIVRSGGFRNQSVDAGNVFGVESIRAGDVGQTGIVTGPVLWTPAQILADLAVWYDGTVTLDGSNNVVTVIDKSGNGNHGTVVGTGTLAPGTWNGFGTVVGSESAASIVAPVASDGAYAWFMTADRLADTQGCLLGFGGIGGYMGAYQNNTSITSNGVTGVVNRVNGDVAVTRQSTLNGISGGGQVGFEWASLDTFISWRFGYYSSSVLYFSGQWGDLLMLKTAPTTAIRQKIEGYLAWRRGTVAKLPVGHPYKDAPPEV